MSPDYSECLECLRSFPEAVLRNCYPCSSRLVVKFCSLNWGLELSCLQLRRAPILLGWTPPSSIFKERQVSLTLDSLSSYLLVSYVIQREKSFPLHFLAYIHACIDVCMSLHICAWACVFASAHASHGFVEDRGQPGV